MQLVTTESNVTELLPTNRELELLKVLWDRQEATVREVCDAMNEAGVELAYTTVLTLLQNMEQKQMVAHRSEGKAYVYRAALQREITLRDYAKGFLSKVFDGSLEEYMLHVLDSQPVSLDELENLSEMVDAKKKETRLSGKKGSKKGGKRK